MRAEDIKASVEALKSISITGLPDITSLYLCSNGVIHFNGGAIHPYSFRDMAGQEELDQLIAERPQEKCNCCD